jgi:PhoH-like ATPase
MTKKTFIVDTNVLLSDPEALFSFEENNIILPLIVIEELDKHKDRQDEVGRNARETVRKISDLTKINKNIKEGIPLFCGGNLRILSVDDINPNRTQTLPTELLTKESGDNSIITLCKEYGSSNQQEKVILVTRDTLLRIKCNVLGIECEDYKKQQATSSISKLYSGAKTLEGEFDIDALYEHKAIDLTDEELKEARLLPNQFVVLQNKQDGRTGLVRYISKNDPLYLVDDVMKVGKLEARNKEQRFALQLLLDPEVKLVTLAGLAGCGKTLLSIAAGLEQVLEKKRYKSLVVCRPVQPMGRDIGFLPGTIEEKMEPWVAPIKDNLRFLISNSGKRSRNVEEALNMYFDDGTIEVEAMTFIRGRSISNAFMIIDEAQNLNVHELKTILTRVGEGTKIVLTGDIEQIDNTYVDSLSNGLTVAIEKFKEHEIAGHVTLIKGERSVLATIAAKILG